MHFGARVTELVRERERLRGAITKDGREFTGAVVILATGHSARDIYRLLLASDVRMPATGFRPGIHSARLGELWPKGIVDRLREGLKLFGKQKPGYLGDDVNLVGFETRTSSPVVS